MKYRLGKERDQNRCKIENVKLKLSLREKQVKGLVTGFGDLLGAGPSACPDGFLLTKWASTQKYPSGYTVSGPLLSLSISMVTKSKDMLMGVHVEKLYSIKIY
jgi:hypothetical protein